MSQSQSRARYAEMHFTPLRRAFVHEFFARELFRFLGFQSRPRFVLRPACPARSLPLFFSTTLRFSFAISTKAHRTAASCSFHLMQRFVTRFRCVLTLSLSPGLDFMVSQASSTTSQGPARYCRYLACSSRGRATEEERGSVLSSLGTSHP